MTLADRLRDAPPERALPVAERILALYGNPRLRYTPITPTTKQALFLSLDRLELFYGGAAGPGKSTALLAAALQYVDVPGYAALLLRRTYADLALPGALMDRAQDWLSGTDAHWNATTHTWTFPSGATLTFGYLDHEEQKRRYQSAEFQFIGWDELTQFTETMYTFLFGRLRKPQFSRGLAPDGTGLAGVPLRMRSASNPGGLGHDWVKARFVDRETRSAAFIPAKLSENPHLDQATYRESLAELSEVEQERLIDGDWDAIEQGGVFDVDAIPIVPDFKGDRILRQWDMAGSKPTPEYPDPDWFVGLRIELNSDTGVVCVTDLVRFREADTEAQERVKATAVFDGPRVPVAFEQEPGSAGKSLISVYSKLLRGIAGGVHGIRPTGDKVTRARPVAAAIGRGEVLVKRAPWNREFFSELRRFPNGAHDDQVDVLSAGYENVGRLTARAAVTGPSDTVRLDDEPPASTRARARFAASQGRLD